MPHGIIDPGTPYAADHSHVDLLLDGRWIATDAHIADVALLEPAQARNLGEDRLMGYGVHLIATSVSILPALPTKNTVMMPRWLATGAAGWRTVIDFK